MPAPMTAPWSTLAPMTTPRSTCISSNDSIPVNASSNDRPWSTPAPMTTPWSTPALMMTPQSTLALMMSNASDGTIFVSESGLQHISSCHPFARFQHSQLFCICHFSVFVSLVLANFFVNANWSYHVNLLLRSFPMSVWVACLPAVGNSFLNWVEY